MRRKKGLREIEWGLPPSGFGRTCIYDNGHLDPEMFLGCVRAFAVSDVPQEDRDGLDIDDVKHMRFRPMSPSEARGYGLDSGVMEAKTGGYPVTAVIL